MKNSAILLLFVSLVAACGVNTSDTANSPATNRADQPPADSAVAIPTPTDKLTADDVAKLKWIEGNWRGMDGDKPFYERYRLDKTSLVVDTIKDETFTEVEETGKFELANGEFGKTEGDQRSAASSITDNSIQFVPAVGSKGNMFRFESVDANTWHAILENPTHPDPARRRKVYVMERMLKQ